MLDLVFLCNILELSVNWKAEAKYPAPNDLWNARENRVMYVLLGNLHIYLSRNTGTQVVKEEGWSLLHPCVFLGTAFYLKWLTLSGTFWTWVFFWDGCNSGFTLCSGFFSESTYCGLEKGWNRSIWYKFTHLWPFTAICNRNWLGKEF